MARPIQDSIVLFGDSITSRQEFPGSLQARFNAAYRRTYDVLNRGYGGYTTRLVLPLMDQFLCRKDEAAGHSRIRLMTIWLGTNDSVLPNADTTQHVPLEQYIANLHKILNNLTSGETYPIVPNIILITPPPICPEASGDSHSRRVEVSKKYVDAMLAVGEEWKANGGKEWAVEIVDCWKGILEAAGGQGPQLQKYLPDGVHLSTEGYEVVWKGIVKAIKQGGLKDRQLDFDTLPYPVPDFSEVDGQDASSVVAKLRGDYIRH